MRTLDGLDYFIIGVAAGYILYPILDVMIKVFRNAYKETYGKDL